MILCFLDSMQIWNIFLENDIESMSFLPKSAGLVFTFCN